MKSRFFSVLAVAAALTLGSALVATAAPVGKAAPVTKELASYFATYGVDAQYLGVPLSQIPADQAAKINAVLTRPDDTVNLVFYHQQLISLIGAALNAAMTADYSPVYLQIGNQMWSAESGINPPSTPVQVPSTATASVSNWVPLS